MTTPKADFVIRFVIEGEQFITRYDSPGAVLEDECLCEIFRLGIVTACTGAIQGTQIFALPIISWDRLREAVISNSPLILRRLQA